MPRSKMVLPACMRCTWRKGASCVRQAIEPIQDAKNETAASGDRVASPAELATTADLSEKILKSCPTCPMVEGYRCRFTPPTPHFDDCHKLWVGQFMVLSYPRVAWNQFEVLKRFERENWPPLIENPLGGKPGGQYANRLKKTTHHLTHREENWLVVFHAHVLDGTIGWEYKIPL